MSVSIEIDQASPVPAASIPENSLFRDSDGDLCLKTPRGVILITSSLTAYGKEDLDEYGHSGFLSKCKPIKGRVEVKVILE